MKHILINKFACTATSNEPSARKFSLANFPILLWYSYYRLLPGLTILIKSSTDWWETRGMLTAAGNQSSDLLDCTIRYCSYYRTFTASKYNAYCPSYSRRRLPALFLQNVAVPTLPTATIPAQEQTRRRHGPPSAMETHVVCRAARIEDSWNADYEHHLNKELIMTQFNFDDLAWKFRSLGQNYQL